MHEPVEHWHSQRLLCRRLTASPCACTVPHFAAQVMQSNQPLMTRGYSCRQQGGRPGGLRTYDQLPGQAPGVAESFSPTPGARQPAGHACCTCPAAAGRSAAYQHVPTPWSHTCLAMHQLPPCKPSRCKRPAACQWTTGLVSCRSRLRAFVCLLRYVQWGTFSAEDACNFALNIYDDGAVLSIGGRCWLALRSDALLDASTACTSAPNMNCSCSAYTSFSKASSLLSHTACSPS